MFFHESGFYHLLCTTCGRVCVFQGSRLQLISIYVQIRQRVLDVCVCVFCCTFHRIDGGARSAILMRGDDDFCDIHSIITSNTLRPKRHLRSLTCVCVLVCVHVVCVCAAHGHMCALSVQLRFVQNSHTRFENRVKSRPKPQDENTEPNEFGQPNYKCSPRADIKTHTHVHTCTDGSHPYQAPSESHYLLNEI